MVGKTVRRPCQETVLGSPGDILGKPPSPQEREQLRATASAIHNSRLAAFMSKFRFKSLRQQTLIKTQAAADNPQ